MSTIQSVNINCAEIELLDSGIIKLIYKPDYEVELSDAKEVEQTLIDLTHGGDIYCLMDTTGRLGGYTQEAQVYIAKNAPIVKEGKMKCSAVIIDNLPSRIFTKFFSKIFKPKFKIKVFSNQSAAMEWLLSEIDKKTK